MNEKWVLDASPIILLGKADLLKIVSSLAKVWIIPEIAAWDLGRGESEVLTLALEKAGIGVVLDDLQARNSTTQLSLFTGIYCILKKLSVQHIVFNLLSVVVGLIKI